MNCIALCSKMKVLTLKVVACVLVLSSNLGIAQQTSLTNDELKQLVQGRTFWFHPNSNIFSRCRNVDFYENGRKLPFDYTNQLQFNFEVVDADIKVRINEQINATTKIEFLEKNMFVYENDEQYLNTCFSDKSPAEHYLKLVQIQKLEEERTDWGEPQTINSTITASGRREQWVYGDGDYLYFKNGILEGIQVRE